MTQSGSPKDNGNLPNKPIVLTDEFKRMIDCHLEHSFELNDENYVLLMPVDAPVEIFTFGEEEEEEPIPIESPEEIELIFEIAKAVLAEQNLTLKQTAVTLTVSGELPELPEENWDTSEEEEEDYEELQLLASFYNEEQEYAIYTPLDPLFILARLEESGQAKVLSQEELEKLEPILPSLEGMLEEHLFKEMN